MRIGISINEYNEMTPRELHIARSAFIENKNSEAEEYKIKYENENRLLTIQAFLISRWVWQKKVDIDKALGEKPKKKKVMTDEEMLAQVKLLNAMFGGEVIDGTEK